VQQPIGRTFGTPAQETDQLQVNRSRYQARPLSALMPWDSSMAECGLIAATLVRFQACGPERRLYGHVPVRLPLWLGWHRRPDPVSHPLQYGGPMNNVNCTSYRQIGTCTHQAAPRRLFGAATCIVWDYDNRLTRDPRLTVPKCALCTPHPRPAMPPPNPSAKPAAPEPPAKRIQEWSL